MNHYFILLFLFDFCSKAALILCQSRKSKVLKLKLIDPGNTKITNWVICLYTERSSLRSITKTLDTNICTVWPSLIGKDTVWSFKTLHGVFPACYSFCLEKEGSLNFVGSSSQQYMGLLLSVSSMTLKV